MRKSTDEADPRIAAIHVNYGQVHGSLAVHGQGLTGEAWAEPTDSFTGFPGALGIFLVERDIVFARRKLITAIQEEGWLRPGHAPLGSELDGPGSDAPMLLHVSTPGEIEALSYWQWRLNASLHWISTDALDPFGITRVIVRSMTEAQSVGVPWATVTMGDLLPLSEREQRPPAPDARWLYAGSLHHGEHHVGLTDRESGFQPIDPGPYADLGATGVELELLGFFDDEVDGERLPAGLSIRQVNRLCGRRDGYGPATGLSSGQTLSEAIRTRHESTSHGLFKSWVRLLVLRARQAALKAAAEGEAFSAVALGGVLGELDVELLKACGVHEVFVGHDEHSSWLRAKVSLWLAGPRAAMSGAMRIDD